MSYYTLIIDNGKPFSQDFNRGDEDKMEEIVKKAISDNKEDSAYLDINIIQSTEEFGYLEGVDVTADFFNSWGINQDE